MTEQAATSAFTLSRQDNGIAVLTMDVPGESMNTLKQAFGDDITKNCQKSSLSSSTRPAASDPE